MPFSICPCIRTTALHGAVLRGQFKVAQPNDTFQKLKFMYTLFL